MGGAAFIISGDVDARLLPANSPEPPEPQSFWARLFAWGSRRPKRATVQALPNGDRHFEIPPGSLERTLVGGFRQWLAGRLVVPSQGSKVVLEYLTVIEPTVYVRGLQRASDEKPDFYVQVTFSGCAGMSETSARAAVHWAAMWYAEVGPQVKTQWLEPYGFRADLQCPPETERMLFLPAGPLGYLEYIDPGPTGEASFEMDEAVAETPEGQEAIGALHAFERFMRPPRCRCQLCDPEFGDARVGVA